MAENKETIIRKVKWLTLLTCLHFNLFAQYSLPSEAKLAKQYIHRIKVSQVNLPRIMADSTIVPWDSATVYNPKHIETYFIGSDGKIDSIYGIPSEKGYYQKEIFTYNEKRELINLKTVLADGTVKKELTLEFLPNGDMKFNSWMLDKLEYEVLCGSDSLIKEKIYHRYNRSEHIKIVEHYDFDKDLATTTWTKNDDTTFRESFQWILVDGKPEKLIYDLWRQKPEKRENKTFHREYPIKENGYLQLGKHVVSDDLRNLINFNRRYDKFSGLFHPISKSMTEIVFNETSKVFELNNFGTSIDRYYFTFTYE